MVSLQEKAKNKKRRPASPNPGVASAQKEPPTIADRRQQPNGTAPDRGAALPTEKPETATTKPSRPRAMRPSSSSSLSPSPPPPSPHQDQPQQPSPSPQQDHAAATEQDRDPATLSLPSKKSILESQLATLTAQLESAHAELQRQLQLTQSPALSPLPPPPPPRTTTSHPASTNLTTTTTPPIFSPSIDATATAIVARHIKLLQQYNEMKDIGQGLMGLLADGSGRRMGDVMSEFGVGAED